MSGCSQKCHTKVSSTIENSGNESYYMNCYHSVKDCFSLTMIGMMLLFQNERQKKIMELIQGRKSLKTAELSELFGVSEMTIYRDIKVLIEQGLVIKTFGGITLMEPNEPSLRDPQACVVCYRNINDRLSYRLILP